MADERLTARATAAIELALVGLLAGALAPASAFALWVGLGLPFPSFSLAALVATSGSVSAVFGGLLAWWGAPHLHTRPAWWWTTWGAGFPVGATSGAMAAYLGTSVALPVRAQAELLPDVLVMGVIAGSGFLSPFWAAWLAVRRRGRTTRLLSCLSVVFVPAVAVVALVTVSVITAY